MFFFINELWIWIFVKDFSKIKENKGNTSAFQEYYDTLKNPLGRITFF